MWQNITYNIFPIKYSGYICVSKVDPDLDILLPKSCVGCCEENCTRSPLVLRARLVKKDLDAKA